jgi:hypothetical protein
MFEFRGDMTEDEILGTIEVLTAYVDRRFELGQINKGEHHVLLCMIEQWQEKEFASLKNKEIA